MIYDLRDLLLMPLEERLRIVEQVISGSQDEPGSSTSEARCLENAVTDFFSSTNNHNKYEESLF